MTRTAVRVWKEFVAAAKEPIVVHLPRNLGGNTSMLSDAMKELGASSISISFEDDPYGFQSDIIICAAGDSLLRKEFRRLAWIVRVLRSADILHFNSGTTLAMPSDGTVRMPGRHSAWWRGLRTLHARYSDMLQVLELHIAQLLGRKTYMTFQGDDLRQGDESLARFDISIAQHVGLDYYNSNSDQRKRQLLSRYKKHKIRFFYLNPDLNWFLDGDGTFLPYSNAIGARATVKRSSPKDRAIRIVHAPSHRLAKGTTTIINTLSHLQDIGFQFEFEIVENLDNVEVASRIAGADLLIDQLFAGWYGGVAVEAMAAGVVVMSYIRQQDLVHIPTEMRNGLPIVSVDLATLSARIKWFLELSEFERGLLSERSIEYANRWHSPHFVARQLLADYGVSQEP